MQQQMAVATATNFLTKNELFMVRYVSGINEAAVGKVVKHGSLIGYYSFPSNMLGAYDTIAECVRCLGRRLYCRHSRAGGSPAALSGFPAARA